jgi:hypothetical protein
MKEKRLFQYHQHQSTFLFSLLILLTYTKSEIKTATNTIKKSILNTYY